MNEDVKKLIEKSKAVEVVKGILKLSSNDQERIAQNALTTLKEKRHILKNKKNLELFETIEAVKVMIDGTDANVIGKLLDKIIVGGNVVDVKLKHNLFGNEIFDDVWKNPELKAIEAQLEKTVSTIKNFESEKGLKAFFHREKLVDAYKKREQLKEKYISKKLDLKKEILLKEVKYLRENNPEKLKATLAKYEKEFRTVSRKAALNIVKNNPEVAIIRPVLKESDEYYERNISWSSWGSSVPVGEYFRNFYKEMYNALDEIDKEVINSAITENSNEKSSNDENTLEDVNEY